MKLPIYMDGHATTPVDPRVLEAMLPCFKEDFGNPASRNHSFGARAEKLVEKARAEVGRLINAEDSEEIIFTSGATESDNLAVKGTAEIFKEKGNHLITSSIEHKAVLDSCRALEKKGFRVTYLPVDQEGRVDLDQLKDAFTEKTILVSIIFANNEVGTIQNMKEIARITKGKGVLFHSDATQAVGKIPVDVQEGMDLLSFSAHKMYGPKGVGALYVRKRNPRVRLFPMMNGGGQERAIRSGTLNVPGIVGFGKACEIAGQEMPHEAQRLLALRERLRKNLWSGLDQIYLNGSLEQRLPHNLNVSFSYVEGESLLMALSDEIALSSGSACVSKTVEPSHVLKALGVKEELAHTAIRFGLGRFNTEEEIDYTVRRVTEQVKRLRELSPLYDLAKTGS